jgi:uncharacterized OB-fold protein
MTPGVAIWRCERCCAALFPQRLLCPHCHGEVFVKERCHQAVVEEVSTIHHMLGQANWQPHRIASVHTATGPRITVGLTEDCGPGTVIDLFEDGTAPYGAARK